MNKKEFIEELKKIEGAKRIWFSCIESEVKPGNFWIGFESGKHWHRERQLFENIIALVEEKELLDDNVFFKYTSVDFELQDRDEDYVKEYLIDLTNRYELIVGDINEYL